MKNDEKQMILQRSNLLPFAKLLLAGIFLAFHLSATAQVRSISGTVSGTNKEPLTGVSVAVKGTSVGVLTGIDGKFTLSVPAAAKTLVFSFVGLDTKEVEIGSENVFNVILTERTVTIEEVVVTGYGTQKKISVTGAIAAVAGSDLVKSPNSGITNTLAGRVTGITTVQYTGVPGGSDPTIFVRGVGSLTASASAPLMLVDGVQRDFAQIDPNEIESISILKDASATSVYGIRGANGVIIVTTKRGVEGAPKISITSQAGFQWPTYMFDMADSYTYATHYNLAQTNDNPSILPSALRFSPTALWAFKNGKYPTVYANSDWTDILVKPGAFQEQQNINISGGSKLVKYFISLGNFFQDGAFKTPGQDTYGWRYTRYNYRANIDIDVTQSTKLSLTIGGRSEKRQAPAGGSGGFNGDFTDVLYATPFSGTYTDGKKYWAQSTYVPSWADGLSAIGYGTGFQQSTTNPLNIDIGVLQKMDFVTKGLAWRFKVSNNSRVSLNKTRSTSQPAYGAYFRCTLDPTAPGDSSIVERKSGSVGLLGYSESSSKSRDWYLETALSYDRSFGAHHVAGLLLYNESKNPYPGGTYPDIPTGYVGLSGRATYEYSSKYLLEINLGYNGSENFAPGNRFGFFPAGSVGWVLTEENFLKNKVAFLDFVKLRVSYGVVGNDLQGSNRFLYLPDTYSLNTGYGANPPGGIFGYSFGTSTDVLQKYATEGKIGNTGVTWEKARKQNYGIDIRLFKGLSITVDYFYEYRDNILTTRNTVPALFAMSLPAVNLGKVENHGYEAEMRWRSKFGNFNYNIGANVSYAKNKIIYMDEVPKHDPYLIQTGKSVGAQFGYVFDGFYTQEDIAHISDFPNPNFTVKPGDCRFKDLNGDNVINSYDQQVIGYPDYPEYNFALSGGIQYKGFDFNFLFNGVTNCSRGLNSGFRFNFGVTYERGLLQYMADNDWTPETAATATWPRMSLTSMTYNSSTSSVYLKDASYLRLKNLEIGYTLKNSTLRSWGISSMRIFANGFDLLTFSKLKLIDPEQRADQAQYPLLQIINIGINLNF
jgi:TonB-linked SusC/RagA family outer membrane protein